MLILFLTWVVRDYEFVLTPPRLGMLGSDVAGPHWNVLSKYTVVVLRDSRGRERAQKVIKDGKTRYGKPT